MSNLVSKTISRQAQLFAHKNPVNTFPIPSIFNVEKLQQTNNMSVKRKCPDSLLTPSKWVRRVLTLAEKIKAIDAVQNGRSNRQVASDFGVGRTQIDNIIRQKTELLQLYDAGTSSKTKYLSPRHLFYPNIDEQVWQRF